MKVIKLDGNYLVVRGLFKKRLFQLLPLDQAYEINFLTLKEMKKNEKAK